jgi:LAO/AO transport system kinase
MAALDAHRVHLAADGRLAIARHRQSEGWLAEALRERFGTRGLARLAALGLDASLPAGAQPFARLRDLSHALEKPR